MSVPTAVFLFDRTGNMARPWADAGYRCICFDVQHVGRTVRDGVIFQHWDALLGAPTLPADSTAVFGFAFPPCTDLAVSGARWFKEKGLRRLAQAIEMVAVADEFLNGLGVPYGIENPVSVISSHWRKPDYTFHPYEFTGFELTDNYSKKTCIWAGGDFEMPAPNRADGLGAPDNRIHAAPPPMTAATSARQRRSDLRGLCSRRTRSNSLSRNDHDHQ
ncbi:hypothetical protein UXJ30_14190 [Burkholderia cenocepacia]|uniref:hypothetical protein n=1 Tax=Burkholderia cenocepacia TaxID=95486 RepID=UPI001E56B796|nr:hypothetical protein [Burkholderia cenocepacia]